MTGVSAYSQRPSARDTEALVMRHAELVKRIAYHLAGRLPASVEVDDLIQAGMLGLLEAASNYSAGRGASFETYAGIRIRGAMLDGLRKLDWAPRSVHRKARAVASAIRELEAELGHEARDADVATKMGVSLDEYHKIVEDAAGCQIASLTTEEGEINAHDPDADPFRDVVDERFRAALTEAIAGLPERERTVMSLYYDDELNLKEIGVVLKVSESRICQIHGQALTRLQARLSGWRDRLGN
jgi:RNA polymerase sigma factor FliA